MPKIGMPAIAMLTMPWVDALQTAADIGYDAFEVDCIPFTGDIDEMKPGDIEKARKISEQTGVEICVHSPFYEINIAASSKGIRNESVKYIKKSIDLCENLGGNALILHSGHYTYRVRKQDTKKNYFMKLQWQYNIDSLKHIINYATTKDVTICLENVGVDPQHIDQTFDDLLEIRNQVDDSLKFTLDIGHARLTEGVQKGIDTLGEHIRHIHFTDNFGKKDDHLPIGEGNSDYSGVIDYIKSFPYIVTLEVLHIGKDSGPMERSLEYFKGL
jgi:sugar phosphate isomerase/epimerase